MAPLCAVCESPTAHTLHFGGRCCKACAAFFRRTIALDLKYECTSSEEPCEINFSMRLVCRECRLRKCIAAGMRSELVRSKRENFACTRRKNSSPRHSEYCAPTHGSSPSIRQSMSPEDDEWHCQYFEDKPFQLLQNEESSRNSSFDLEYCSSYPSSSRIYQNPVDQTNHVLQNYSSMETSLNSRRRIMYTNTDMDCILDSFINLQCPYTINDLRPHDYRTFRGLVRHDFVILYDYATRFPEFPGLSNHEKNMFFRFVLAVDFIVSTCYISYRLGENRQLILTNGEYLCMDPLPYSGQEPFARQYFESEDDFSKYKALMPLHISIWEEVVIPFSKLNISFDEFVLLKALTVWHVTYYKLTEEGREKCRHQRNIIIDCLSKMCHGPNGGGERRMGELLMSMNYLMESVQKLTANYVMFTFFDVINCDSMLHEMLNFKY